MCTPINDGTSVAANRVIPEYVQAETRKGTYGAIRALFLFVVLATACWIFPQVFPVGVGV